VSVSRQARWEFNELNITKVYYGKSSLPNRSTDMKIPRVIKRKFFKLKEEM